MERNRIELIVVDGALLGRRNRNFLVIAGSCFLENSLEMVFLLTMVSIRLGTGIPGVLVVTDHPNQTKPKGECQAISREETRDIITCGRRTKDSRFPRPVRHRSQFDYRL